MGLKEITFSVQCDGSTELYTRCSGRIESSSSPRLLCMFNKPVESKLN